MKAPNRKRGADAVPKSLKALGGKRSWSNMTPEARSARARAMAMARWEKPR
jgi:hypothetical protein